MILIDGIHTGYVGGKPGPLGSQIEPEDVGIFVQLARDAVAGKKRVIITPSGRRAVAMGPMGTEEPSEVRTRRLLPVGLAGNSAPDHVDHRIVGGNPLRHHYFGVMPLA